MGNKSNPQTSPRKQNNQRAQQISAKTFISMRDIKKDYNFGRTIGHGNFGIIREATRKKIKNSEDTPSAIKKYAIKTIHQDMFKAQRDLLINEINIMLEIDHPNIIKIYDAYEDQKYLHIVMEICNGGELLDRIIKNGRYSEDQSKMLLRQMLSALVYLHEKGIVHRDIKPENFMFGKGDQIKLIDFGISVKFSGAQDSTGKTRMGTCFYLAPEVLTGTWGKECDIWSLGVVLYVMLSGNLPFVGNNNEQIYKQIMKGNYSFQETEWLFVSKQAKDLIRKMMNPDVTQRITAEQALKHRWMTQMDIESPIMNYTGVLENLRGYKANKKLYQEAMKVVINFLDYDEIKHLSKAFKKVDKDKRGFITAQDLQTAMQDIGLNIAKNEIDNIMQQVDYIGNGSINYSDFIIASMNQKLYMEIEQLWEVFNFFDRDRSGYITVDNLKRAFQKLGTQFTDSELQEIIKEVGQGGEGKISFKEFRNFMQTNTVKNF